MDEIELRKAVIFIMWLTQAQPLGFVTMFADLWSVLSHRGGKML